jgi:hypothetical protein
MVQVAKLSIDTKTVFTGEVDIPALVGTTTKDATFVYQWDPNLTKINSVAMSLAVQSSGWTAGTGEVVVEIFLNGTWIDSYTFTGPGIYSVNLDVSTVFFNGPNLLRFHCYWQVNPWLALPNLTEIVNGIRVDIGVNYTGIPPAVPKTLGDYAPYIALGVSGGILAYILWLVGKRR